MKKKLYEKLDVLISNLFLHRGLDNLLNNELYFKLGRLFYFELRKELHNELHF